MKKRESFFDRKLDEAYDIKKMLEKEGKTNAESRAYVYIATILLFIESALRRISFALFILLGLIVSKILS